MSEFEIKRRQDYKRNRKKWILIQGCALALLVVIALSMFLVYDRMNRTYYIEYTESSSADYKVAYKNNSFFEEEWVGSGQSYVSSLISGISADFEYALNMPAANMGFDYTYGITAQLIISDKTSGDHIYDPVDVLLADTSASTARSNNVFISENVLVDFAAYNSEAKSFISTYGLKNATAMLVVTMKVNVVSSSDLFDTSDNKYSIALNIPLCEENFSIFSTQSSPAGEVKQLAYRGAVDSNVFLIISIVFAVLSLLLGIGLIFFVYITRNEDINYTNKVRKLLSSYRSFIQQIEGEYDTEGYQLITVKTFTEMLGIRDTIQAPILMYENKDETMTRFLIPTNTKLLYVFEIKVENYDTIYGIYEEEANATAVEADEGDITEEAAVSTVIEFADSEGEAEAIILDETVSTEDIAEAMATPDVILSEIDYEEYDREEYESTEEAPGVEVVGVVWPERAKKNKIYSYDPNGEQLEEGDMVLVPTRDAARDRTVIRKAAIARPNHTIDPATHHHVLKKIIGVIKRRAEAVLTPDSKDN